MQDESGVSPSEAKARIENWKEAFAQMVANGFMMLSKQDGDDVMARIHQLLPAIEINGAKPQVWTRKKPTVPGTYWIWAKNLGFSQMCFAMNSRTGAGLFLTTMGGAMIKTPVSGDELFEGQWICGPIAEPDDPPAAKQEQLSGKGGWNGRA